MLKRIPANPRDCWKTNARGSSSTSRLLFQALSLVGEILRRASASPRLPACLWRASGAKPVYSLLACSTVIGNLPISDSENEGVGSKIAAPLSRASASWPFTNLGPFGLLWRNTDSSPVRSSEDSHRLPAFSCYATSFLSTIVGTCINSSHSER